MANIVVLGGYGLIGLEILRAFHRQRNKVTAVGRTASAVPKYPAQVTWHIADLATLPEQEWHDLIKDADVIVNASGALQDGLKDDLEAIHVTAVERLAKAAAQTGARVIQISAAGVSLDADTAFFETKARGDATLACLCPNHVILRPTLVLAPAAYGGSALLRAAAALPLIRPMLMQTSQIQTVGVDAVADAVILSATDDIPAGTIADITEDTAHTFPDLVQDMRNWLGFPPARHSLLVPKSAFTLVGKCADALSWLGWRSPMRSTSLRVLQKGIQGDPEPWRKLTGRTVPPLKDSLAAMPATAQDRIAARLYLALPLAIATLSLFWLASGIVALLNIPDATVVLTARGTSPNLAKSLVIGGAVLDVALGFGILWRNWVRRAALGMIALSAAYIGGSLIFAPDLWFDPLGPMIKVLPSIALATMVALLIEDR